MELSKVIEERRTVKDFTDQPVPAALLNQAVEAGLWAQNHRMTQPWRFTFFGPETTARLAQDFSLAASKPAIVAVTCLKSDGGPRELEDYAAVSCAIQNIQLQAWDLGLGMQWSTGAMATSPQVSALLDLEGNKEFMAGLLFFGYPLKVPAPAPRKPLSEVSTQLP